MTSVLFNNPQILLNISVEDWPNFIQINKELREAINSDDSIFYHRVRLYFPNRIKPEQLNYRDFYNLISNPNYFKLIARKAVKKDNTNLLKIIEKVDEKLFSQLTNELLLLSIDERSFDSFKFIVSNYETNPVTVGKAYIKIIEENLIDFFTVLLKYYHDIFDFTDPSPARVMEEFPILLEYASSLNRNKMIEIYLINFHKKTNIVEYAISNNLVHFLRWLLENGFQKPEVFRYASLDQTLSPEMKKYLKYSGIKVYDATEQPVLIDEYTPMSYRQRRRGEGYVDENGFPFRIKK